MKPPNIAAESRDARGNITYKLYLIYLYNQINLIKMILK